MTTRTVLAVGSHPDDIEIGCGGTLAKHVANGDRVFMLVMTNGHFGPGEVSKRFEEQREACRVLGIDPDAQLFWGQIRDGEVGRHELDVVHIIEGTLGQLKPEIIYTHASEDSHQDHRAVGLMTLGAARRYSTILTYESPSSLHFTPTVFVDVTSTINKKVAALECHRSQVQASKMVDPQQMRNLAGYRGVQIRREAAEGFLPIRALLDI